MQIDSLFHSAMDAGIFSKAVVGFLFENGESEIRHYGTAENSVFDLASVTKVCPTSTLALKFVLEGKLNLDAKLIDYIPEMQTNYREEILIRHLLTHSLDYRVRMSSLKDLAPEKILQFLYSYQFEKRPGTVFNYGNPASILLGIVLMRISGKTLQELAEENFFTPLSMTRSGWDPLSRISKEEIVATENCPWRGRILQGEIHDESAFSLKKLFPVGSAGMFSTVPDLLKFVRMILNDGVFECKRILPAGILQLVSTNALEDRIPQECTALGWELDAEKFIGKAHHPRLFGKTGFTGTSIVADAERKSAVILLSNFTYPKRENSAARINDFRARLSEEFFLKK